MYVIWDTYIHMGSFIIYALSPAIFLWKNNFLVFPQNF